MCVSSCFVSHFGFAGAFFFFASERFSLKNRTHKNEMEYRREI